MKQQKVCDVQENLYTVRINNHHHISLVKFALNINNENESRFDLNPTSSHRALSVNCV